MLHAVIFGGLMLDRYCEIDRYPERGQDCLITKEYSIVGGCSINMGVTFNNLGGCCHIVSQVGSGEAGRQILRYMEEHQLSERFVSTTSSEESGYCQVLLEPDGERTFLTKEGSEKHFPTEFTISDFLMGDCCAVTGYYLLHDPMYTVEAVEAFAAAGKPVLIDFGPLGDMLSEEIRLRMMKAASILSVNASERHMLPCEARPDQLLLEKKGAAGGTVTYQGASFDYSPASARVVDTTGAGDSFDGGLLFGMASGLSAKEAVSLAAKCAAKTIEIKGPHGFWEV